MTKAETIMNKLGANRLDPKGLQEFLIQRNKLRILNKPMAHEQTPMLESIDNHIYSRNVRP